MEFNKEEMKKKMESFKKDAKKTVNKFSSKAIESKEKVMSALDVNGDGNVDINDIIIMALRVPKIRIDRAEFLRIELQKNYTEDIVEKAINETPAKAGIKPEEINRIVDSVITYERNCVTGISAALGVPGGFGAVATLPVDLIQYYGYMLRATQKLMYLYGFPEINVEEKNQTFDSETINTLTICLGTMYGVAGANKAIQKMATGLAQGISKKIMRTALTKGTIYPMVKSIAKWFNVNLTKKLLEQMAKTAIPVVGGVIGGGFTYVSFKICCDKLKNSLQDTLLSNPNREANEEEKYIINNVDFNVVDED